MFTARLIGLSVAAFLVSGCAALPAHKDMARLQSQFNLLDERVSQLERTAGTELSSASSTEATSPEQSAPLAANTNIPRSAGQDVQAIAIPSTKPTTRDIQQALKNSGFYQGAIDGKMGPLTHDAIKEFQRVHGLKDDGVVGKQTWVKLREYASISSGNAQGGTSGVLK